jgi:hypothetical protein
LVGVLLAFLFINNGMSITAIARGSGRRLMWMAR